MIKYFCDICWVELSNETTSEHAQLCEEHANEQALDLERLELEIA